MTCARVGELVAELALEVIDGDERGSVLAHIEHCSHCRLEVARSTEAVETLVLLAPAAEPPGGFEERVLERLDATRRAPPDRTWRFLRPLAAVAAATVIAVSSLVLFPALTKTGGNATGVAAVTMRNDNGDTVGNGYLHRGRPAWIVVAVPGWNRRLRARYGTDRTYSVRIERRDGSRYASRTPFDPHGTWAASLGDHAGDVASVAILDDQGHVWCTGRFRPE